MYFRQRATRTWVIRVTPNAHGMVLGLGSLHFPHSVVYHCPVICVPLSGWFVSVFLSRVLCVSRQYFSAKFARPLFSDRFTLRLLLTRYFALYSALRAPTGPGGRTEPTELCSLSRKLIILFVTDNKYLTHDSQSQPAQLQRIKSRLKGSNCHQSQSLAKEI